MWDKALMRSVEMSTRALTHNPQTKICPRCPIEAEIIWIQRSTVYILETRV